MIDVIESFHQNIGIHQIQFLLLYRSFDQLLNGESHRLINVEFWYPNYNTSFLFNRFTHLWYLVPACQAIWHYHSHKQTMVIANLSPKSGEVHGQRFKPVTNLSRESLVTCKLFNTSGTQTYHLRINRLMP